MNNGDKITLEVFRYLPEQEAEPRFQSYTVPFHQDWVVLDALNHIKDYVDGTLSYRWSCRMGVCGSCGMMVNGEPKLTCAAFLKDFLHKMKEVKTWLIPKEEKPVAQGEYLQTPAELAHYKQFSMCINCMLCYAACPVYGLEPRFLGPAAIALAQRYNLDSRDGAREERAQMVSSSEGIWECTFIGECSRVCPKHVDPAGAIQQAKAINTQEWWRDFLMPWGKRGA